MTMSVIEEYLKNPQMKAKLSLDQQDLQPQTPPTTDLKPVGSTHPGEGLSLIITHISSQDGQKPVYLADPYCFG